jgi:hypothetical protein
VKTNAPVALVMVVLAGLAAVVLEVRRRRPRKRLKLDLPL